MKLIQIAGEIEVEVRILEIPFESGFLCVQNQMVDPNRAAARIQSYWRGYRVRKVFTELHKWYWDVAIAIDGANATLKQSSYQRHKRKCCVITRPLLQNRDPFHCLLSTESTQSDATLDNSYSGSICTDHTVPDHSKVESTFNDNTIAVALSEQGDEQTVKESLLKRKRDVTMELLWVQQAIESRRNYLKIKEQLT